MSSRRPGIRLDRVSRVALLLVLVGLAALYVGPARSYIDTRGEAAQRSAHVAELKRENAALKARKRALETPSELELEARRLGMVRPGERAYVLRGLPGGAGDE